MGLCIHIKCEKPNFDRKYYTIVASLIAHHFPRYNKPKLAAGNWAWAFDCVRNFPNAINLQSIIHNSTMIAENCDLSRPDEQAAWGDANIDDRGF